jgi:hypothetical protein
MENHEKLWASGRDRTTGPVHHPMQTVQLRLYSIALDTSGRLRQPNVGEGQGVVPHPESNTFISCPICAPSGPPFTRNVEVPYDSVSP